MGLNEIVKPTAPEVRQMIVDERSNGLPVEEPARPRGPASQRVDEQLLERPAQPSGHWRLEALLAMFQYVMRHIAGGDLAQQVLLSCSADLELWRDCHRHFDELVVKERYSHLERVPHTQPVGQREYIVDEVGIQVSGECGAQRLAS